MSTENMTMNIDKRIDLPNQPFDMYVRFTSAQTARIEELMAHGVDGFSEIFRHLETLFGPARP